MSPFEIALIIVGIVCIIASCLMIDQKKEDTVDTELGTVTEQILFNQLSEANDKISSHVNHLKEEIYEKTKEDMNRISNEKIMAVHEYSDQVLSDIKKSHNEVLFLYQMLSEKEEDLKTSINEMQKMKRELEQYYRSAEEHTEGNHQSLDTVNRTPYVSDEFYAEQESQDTMNSEHHYTKALQEIENQEFAGHIDEILSLSKQGCSVIEISKRLGLGQGEVKLVLDYNNR